MPSVMNDIFVSITSFSWELCCADLVVAVLCDVAHPRQSLVPALLDDLEVAHLQSRRCEVGDFELDVNRGLGINVLWSK